MMTHSILLALVVASSLGAQQQPPIRQLGATVASTKESFTGLPTVRTLPGGRVLVNDGGKRRVLMLDSSLSIVSTVADTTAATGNAYSGPRAGLIPYRADSSLFIDPQSLSMMVIDPNGKMGRVLSVPRSDDANSLAGFGGVPGFDAQGRLIYRANNFRFNGPPPRGPNGEMKPPEFPDSAAIVRIDLSTRKMDTITYVKVPKIKMNMTQREGGGFMMTTEINPLPVVDEWSVLSDGSLAVIRGRDYHVDLFSSDGKMTAATKVPFEWQRLTDEDKVAFIDSTKAQREKMLAAQAAAAPAAVGAAGGAAGEQRVVAGGPGAGGGAAGGPQMVIRMDGPGGGGGPPRGGGNPMDAMRSMTFIPAAELPDYKPPFFNGAARSDENGNLWVRTIPTKKIPGGPVYDVIDKAGKLIDRVQVPANRTIVGFGKDGSVYLLQRDPTAPMAAATIERARVR